MDLEDRLSYTASVASDVHPPSLLRLLQDQQSISEEQTPTMGPEIDKPEYADLIHSHFSRLTLYVV
jgi:hypothetical protein